MIWRQNVQNFWVRSQNYKSNQITMERIDLTSKQSKMSSYVVKHWKLRKTQNYKSNQIRINLHRFDVKTIKNVELRRKTFKTTQNYESHQITMNCIDLMSKRQTNAKLQKWSYFDEFASIWRQNDQNNAKLRKWSNYNALHRFDVKTI